MHLDHLVAVCANDEVGQFSQLYDELITLKILYDESTLSSIFASVFGFRYGEFSAPDWFTTDWFDWSTRRSQDVQVLSNHPSSSREFGVYLSSVSVSNV